tara:strand:- start:181 stop:576 length:396 start_codon:yes stop_codon:yes gene_type:complete
MKKFLTILLLIYLQPVFSSETVLYCITKDRTGFSGDEIKRFVETRFTLSFNDDYKLLKMYEGEEKEKMLFFCKVDMGYPDELFCTEDSSVPYIFLYHTKNKKFTYFQGTVLGYPSGGKDTTIVSIGTCNKF